MRATTPGVRLKLQAFDEITSRRGLNTDAARCAELGITSPHLSKIRNGIKRPGALFIYRTLTALSCRCEDLFEVEDLEAQAS